MTTPSRPATTKRARCRAACAIAGSVFCGIAALGLWLTIIAQWVWLLEGVTVYIPSYGALALAGALACLYARTWRRMALGLACACIAAAAIVPCYWPAPNRAAPGQAPNLRVMTLNVFEHYGNPEALLRLVRETKPDLLLFQEFDALWAERLRALEAGYPGRALAPRYPGGRNDLGLYWRAALPEARVLAGEGLPAMETRLQAGGRTLRIVNAHAAAPFTPGRARSYRDQMEALARYAAQNNEPILLAGDLNCGRWSRLYRALLREGGLVDARQGFGVLGSWPAFLGPLRTGLDHILVSKDIRIVRCWVPKGIGSDHRPLIADLYVPPLEPGA